MSFFSVYLDRINDEFCTSLLMFYSQHLSKKTFVLQVCSLYGRRKRENTLNLYDQINLKGNTTFYMYVG